MCIMNNSNIISIKLTLTQYLNILDQGLNPELEITASSSLQASLLCRECVCLLEEAIAEVSINV